MEALSINEIAQRLLASLPAAVRGAQADLEKNFRVVLHNSLGKMDLVTRDEFDVQTKVLERTRARLAVLEARLGPMGLSTPTVIYGRNFQTRSSGNQKWTVVPFALGEDRMCVQVCIAPNDDVGKKTTRTGFPVPHLLRT